MFKEKLQEFRFPCARKKSIIFNTVNVLADVRFMQGTLKQQLYGENVLKMSKVRFWVPINTFLFKG